MPGQLLHAYDFMLPRLRAREALRHVQEIALGNGLVKKEQAREVMRKWEHEAGSPQPTPNPEDVARQLQAWGIPRVSR